MSVQIDISKCTGVPSDFAGANIRFLRVLIRIPPVTHGYLPRHPLRRPALVKTTLQKLTMED